MNRVLKVLSAVLILIAMLIAVYAWLLATKDPQARKHGAGGTTGAGRGGDPRHRRGRDTQCRSAQSQRGAPAEVVGGFQTIPEVTGRVAVMPVASGAPILESQLNSGLAARVASGERAVAIRIDEQTGVGNRVRPGDFVDVFVLLRRDGNEIDHSQARLLLPRLRVLSFGAASVDTGAATSAKSQDVIRTAVLAVPIDRIPELSLGDNAGKLTLALRNPADLESPDQGLFADHSARAVATADAVHADTGIALAQLAGDPAPRAMQKTAAVPHPAPVSKGSVEVIRAGKLETVAY